MLDNRSRFRQALVWYVPVLLLAVYPIAVVIGANLGEVPLSLAVLVRATVDAVSTTVLLLLVLRVVQPDFATRAAWSCWVLLLLTFYSSVVLALERLEHPVYAGDPRFAISYAVSTIAIATIVSRPWKVQPRDPTRFTIVAVALILITLSPGLLAGIREGAAPWRKPADMLIESSLSHRQMPPATPRRDIYYIVLDGFGRPDTIRDYYGVDLSSFVESLKSRGFYVADRARTNYTQTFLSIASTLNMNYLDTLASAVGADARDRRPLAYLIQQNALMRMASRAGYRIVAIGSDYTATERFARADVCVCGQYGLDEIELAAIALTPLAALPVNRWNYDAHDAHRRKVIESFAALESSASHAGPTFVFAHILVPHPPFVFGADGSPRKPPRTVGFGFNDGDHYRGSSFDYVNGYREQVQYVAGRLAALTDALLDESELAPIIVIHGDHGPGLRLRWEQPDATDMRERMEIFAAYYFPDGGPALYPGITPVNGVRALARYLGVELPLLPDASFFSTWSRPYDFIPEAPPR